jgi:hypothetical protein
MHLDFLKKLLASVEKTQNSLQQTADKMKRHNAFLNRQLQKDKSKNIELPEELSPMNLFKILKETRN